MIHLYKYRTENPADSAAEKQTIRKFHDEDGREISRGMHYLKDALSRRFPEDKITIYKDENRKPHADREGIEVSVTHAKNVVICAVSDVKIGIDFEERRPGLNPMKIAGRHFTDEEILMVQERGDDAFYEIWCRKEAFMKHEGSGLSYGLKNIQTAKKTVDESGKERAQFLDEIEGVPVFGLWLEEGYFACTGIQGDLTWIEIQH